MSIFYENTLLREEFKLVQKLQKDKEFAKYVTARYEDRVTGETKTVLSAPTMDKYPETYIVDYRMPVYVAEGQLCNDFHGTARITLSEYILSEENRNRIKPICPEVQWGANFLPFNNHIDQEHFCPGENWAVAKDAGLWFFIMSIGATLNQDEFLCAEGRHFNENAYNYWVRRGKKPVTNINWPLDLLARPDIKVIQIEKPKINIVRKTNDQQPIKKINIIKK